MSRVRLGRHGQLDSDAGDPLDGLVNMFDIGLVLAVAFLIAGLGFTLDSKEGKLEQRTDTASKRSGTTTSVPPADPAKQRQGVGTAIGQVYRLSDGSIVYRDGDTTKPLSQGADGSLTSEEPSSALQPGQSPATTPTTPGPATPPAQTPAQP